MKKTIFAAAILVALTSTATFAQTTDLDFQARMLTREMSANLGVNDADYIRLKNVNLEFLMKEAEITAIFKNDISMRNTKLIDVQNNYDAQLRTFLNVKQMEGYANFKTNISNASAIAIEADKN